MKASLDEFIGKVEHLPPSPRVLVKLLEMFKNPNVNVNEVVALISHDPSFTVEVLKRCNSAYFAGAEPANNIFDAVSRLGFDEIYQIVLAMFAATTILRPEAEGMMHVEILWRHSVAVAVAAGVLARETGESHPAAFTAGLLHEVGKVIMVSADKAKYAQAVMNAALFKRTHIVAEKELFGFDHAEVGARLLERWGLPPNIVAAVGHHHELAGAEPYERLAATVHLGNLLAHATGVNMMGDVRKLQSGAAVSMGMLQLDIEKLEIYLPVMQEAVASAKALTLG